MSSQYITVVYPRQSCQFPYQGPKHIPITQGTVIFIILTICCNLFVYNYYKKKTSHVTDHVTFTQEFKSLFNKIKILFSPLALIYTRNCYLIGFLHIIALQKYYEVNILLNTYVTNLKRCLGSIRMNFVGKVRLCVNKRSIGLGGVYTEWFIMADSSIFISMRPSIIKYKNSSAVYYSLSHKLITLRVGR
jgi:hypothetical protein